MSEIIAGLYLARQLYESADPVQTLLSLNPLEFAGLAALLGTIITMIRK